MIIREILNLLKQDTELMELLESTSQDSKIYMNATTFQGDCIVYTYTQLTNDKIKAQSRIEIDCISSDYEKGMLILRKVQKVLLTLADEPATENIIETLQNGGGYVFDKDVKLHMFKAIFLVKERVR